MGRASGVPSEKRTSPLQDSRRRAARKAPRPAHATRSAGATISSSFVRLILRAIGSFFLPGKLKAAVPLRVFTAADVPHHDLDQERIARRRFLDSPPQRLLQVLGPRHPDPIDTLAL